MIDCTQAVEQLWDYIESSLDEVNNEQMEQHLAFCRTCCGEMDFAQELRKVLGDSSKPTVPDDVASRLENFLDELGGASDQRPDVPG